MDLGTKSFKKSEVSLVTIVMGSATMQIIAWYKGHYVEKSTSNSVSERSLWWNPFQKTNLAKRTWKNDFWPIGRSRLHGMRPSKHGWAHAQLPKPKQSKFFSLLVTVGAHHGPALLMRSMTVYTRWSCDRAVAHQLCIDRMAEYIHQCDPTWFNPILHNFLCDGVQSMARSWSKFKFKMERLQDSNLDVVRSLNF